MGRAVSLYPLITDCQTLRDLVIYSRSTNSARRQIQRMERRERTLEQPKKAGEDTKKRASDSVSESGRPCYEMTQEGKNLKFTRLA